MLHYMSYGSLAALDNSLRHRARVRWRVQQRAHLASRDSQATPQQRRMSTLPVLDIVLTVEINYRLVDGNSWVLHAVAYRTFIMGDE